MSFSLHPNDQIKGGLLDDFDATLTNTLFKLWAYPNSGNVTVAMVSSMVLDNGDKYEGMWSVGDPEQYNIVNDGKGLESKRGTTGTVDSSNFSMFTRELLNADTEQKCMKALTENNIGLLDGLKAHWIRKAQPDRTGLKKTDDRDRTTLVPEKIINYPGGGKAKSQASVQKTQAAATQTANDMENEAAVAIAEAALNVIKEQKKGEVIKSAWSTTVLSGPNKVDAYKAADIPTKDAVKRLLKNAEFLTQFDVAVDEAGNVTLPA
jgi:hypothetical protein